MEPDEIRAIVKAVEARSGPGVEMLPGTLQEVNDTQGVVLLDGTTQPAGVNVVTECEPGDRVMVLFVPPRGGFVVGRFAVAGPESYRFVEQLRFTSVGTATFTKATYPWLAAVRVTCVGGGGVGGQCGATGAGEASMGGGGGGGGTAFRTLAVGSVPTSVTVTVGAGGTGVSDGGNSSFGSLVVAGGGEAGDSRPASAAAFGVEGGAGGTAIVSDYGASGTAGTAGFGSGQLGFSGNGGASHLGGGGKGRITTSGTQRRQGFGGLVYGGGGGGSINAASASPFTPGGAGAQGIVIVDLYA